MKLEELVESTSITSEFHLANGTMGDPHSCKLFDNDVKIGFVSWSEDDNGDMVYVSDAGLESKYRGKGLGKRMYLESFADLKSNYDFARASRNITKKAENVWKSFVRDGIAFMIYEEGTRKADSKTYCVNLKRNQPKAPEGWRLLKEIR